MARVWAVHLVKQAWSKKRSTDNDPFPGLEQGCRGKCQAQTEHCRQKKGFVYNFHLLILHENVLSSVWRRWQPHSRITHSSYFGAPTGVLFLPMQEV